MLCYGENLKGNILTVLTASGTYEVVLEKLNLLVISDLETAIDEEFVMDIFIDNKELHISDMNIVRFIEIRKIV